MYKIKYTQQITTEWRRRLRYNIKNNTKNSLIHKRKIVNENNNFHTLCTIFTSNESSEWVREGGRGRAVKSRHIEAHDDRCFFFSLVHSIDSKSRKLFGHFHSLYLIVRKNFSHSLFLFQMTAATSKARKSTCLAYFSNIITFFTHPVANCFFLWRLR